MVIILAVALFCNIEMQFGPNYITKHFDFFHLKGNDILFKEHHASCYVQANKTSSKSQMSYVCLKYSLNVSFVLLS